jgi:hypothetical protein
MSENGTVSIYSSDGSYSIYDFPRSYIHFDSGRFTSSVFGLEMVFPR